MYCLMLLSSRRWVCALSGSVRGRIGELMLSKSAVTNGPEDPSHHKKRGLRIYRTEVLDLRSMGRRSR